MPNIRSIILLISEKSMVPEPSMSANMNADCAVWTTSARLTASSALAAAFGASSIPRGSVGARADKADIGERAAGTEPVWKCEPAVQPSDAEHQNMPNQLVGLWAIALLAA